MAKAAATRDGSAQLFPRDSIYELQKSVQGVELLSFLPPPDGVSDKRLSKFVETAFHPLRPWIAAIEPKGNGVVWNYETKEIVHEFSLEISLDASDAAGDDAAAVAAPPAAASKAGGLLAKSSSPTATTYMKSNKSKGGALRMLFYDHDAIATVTQNAADRVCFDEWIVVLTATHVVMCDMNQSSAIRSIAADELHRQAPCSIEILPSGLLAIGCQDGKIRIWSPQLWRIVDTIDTGSTKDVQQLLFLPSQSLNASRSGSGSSATSSSVHASYGAQHLVAVALDGKVVTWRVSVVDGASFECKKVSELELKEAFKAFDTSSGVNELKLHAHQEMLSAAARDGPVFFFDVAPLFRQAKGPNLLGILPSNKLPGALVVPGPRKSSFVVLSIAPSTAAVSISELVNKGRLVGRDNVPSSFHEFAVSASSESKDLKLFANQPPALAKKFKVLSLTSSRRDADALCCLTTFGLLILKACCIPEVTPAFIIRGADKAPLLAFPSTAKVMLRFFGEETSAKQEDHKLQSGGDAPNEKLRTPSLQPCPSNSTYLAATLPASAHIEILQMDSELRNQKSITMSSIFSGNAIAIAWHPTKPRFAALVPQDPSSRRMTRTQTSAHITPRRRGFMFGGSSKNIGDDASGSDAKLRNQMARMMALTIFEISKESGHVEMVEENCAGADDRLLHIFSGPLLGVVKFETSDDAGSSGDGGSSKSLTEAHHNDSPSSMMRSKRTESSVFAAITPTFASGGSGSGSLSEPPAVSEVDTSDMKRTFLEFYEWDSLTKSEQSKPTLGSTLKRVGNSAVECPLALEWECTTNRFCALIYPASVKIYRATAAPPDVVCLHEIPTSQPAQSLKWVNHTLFFSTSDEVKCCIVSKTRCFTFDLASTMVADETLDRAARDTSNEFPQPKRLPAGATAVLGVFNQQLVLAGPVQALHSIDLSNRVLQCCILISRGKEEQALQMAETLSPALSDWLGSVFEAFGCIQQALKLSSLSTALKVNICIKHNVLDELEKLLAKPHSDSPDLTGTSLFQRGCMSLHRANQSPECLQRIFPIVLASKRYNDAIFIGSLLRDQEFLVQAYSAREDWRAAHHCAKQSSDASLRAQSDECVSKWNDVIQAPTSSWKIAPTLRETRRALRSGYCGIWHLAAEGRKTNESMALLRIEPHRAIATLDGHRARQAEHVLFHPTRGSLISVTSSLLQEIDLATGALVGEIDFDLLSIAPPTAQSDKAHVLDHLVAVGSYYVVGVFQSRFLVVWDLQEHVLQSISEVEKMQKSMLAIAGSLCSDHWLFYASEGSASIKVTSVDSKEIPKKISRKAANRSVQLVSLAYNTAKRTLCCGSSDGSVQFYAFSEDNALGGKDESSSATLLFTTPANQSPAVQLTFATTGSNASYLVVGYQSRSIEVWSLLANGAGSRQRDPQRVAATQLSPQQAVDFARKSGELAFSLHPQRPILIAHWHSHSSSSSVVAWEFRPTIGAGSGAGSGGVLSEWSELISAHSRASSTHSGGDDSSSCAAGVCWHQGSLVCYKSIHSRSLSILTVSSSNTPEAASEEWPRALIPPSLTSKFTLSLEQYWNYQDIPASLMQITTNPEPSSGAAEFILQHFALQTGASEKLDDLPVWRNYQGKSLVPCTLVSNQSQTVACVKLRDPAKAQSSLPPSTTPNSSVDAEDNSFSYVVVETKSKPGASSARRNEDADGGDSGSAAFRVSCGSQLDALDFCFAEFRTDEAKQTHPWVLVVLASTGKSLCVQVKCDQVESSRILLQREVLRVFSSPIALSSQSSHCSTVGSRLLYVTADSADSSRQVLQLSGDDLSVPAVAAGASATTTWKANANEGITKATWNKTAAGAASATEDSELLLAVQTTTRLVVLDKSLNQVRAYDLVRDLHAPQSMLWMAQTLLFVTKDNQLRYLTPLRADLASQFSRLSRLVCCLKDSDRGSVQRTELLSVCGDRLAYAVTDLRTLEAKAFLRPVAICEPLVAGFVTPNAKLKAILERDVLVFAMSGGTESLCPLTDFLLELLYHEFGWKETTLRLLDALTNPSAGGSGSAAAAAAAALGSATTSSYPKTSHLSTALLASLYLHSHKWKEFLQVFLATDPGLEEYALADEDSGAAAAKLPSRTGQLAQRFRRFGRILDAIGQSALALKCFDLAGDDLSILEMTKTVGGSHSASAAAAMLTSLQRDWATMNPPLASLVSAESSAGSKGASAAQLASAIWRRHDLFSLLCCEALLQNERRSRLLTSVKPFDKMTVLATKTDSVSGGGDPLSSTSLDKSSCPRASVLQWKRLVPEDAKDSVGVSTTPHFSSEEPKNPSYGLAASSSSLLSGGAGSGLATASGDNGVGADGIGAAMGGGAAGSAAASSTGDSGKMTIGPFVDDEDAVVAYWRFEEGATLPEDAGANGTPVESLDTSKRENNLQLVGFGSATTLVTSSAPVDKGEEGRIQEEFALRFAANEGSAAEDQLHASGESGARCIVRAGSTLDIGFVFDEDPYRRKLTFEAWVRNFVFAKKQQQQQEDDDGDSFDASPSQFADSGTRTIVCRKGGGRYDDDSSLWWSFALVDGSLVLEFAGHSIRSDERVANAASWHHVAFSVDILSSKQASVKLFLHGRCVGAKDVSSVESNAKLYASALSSAASSESGVLSHLHVGWQLREYEMTEVRLWAAARTQDQLSDMKENYLGIAEAKKRMKIAIHQRNCQCEKCHARRTKAPAMKLAMATPFPTTPPSATVRDRRRPQPKA